MTFLFCTLSRLNVETRSDLVLGSLLFKHRFSVFKLWKHLSPQSLSSVSLLSCATLYSWGLTSPNFQVLTLAHASALRRKWKRKQYKAVIIIELLENCISSKGYVNILLELGIHCVSYISMKNSWCTLGDLGIWKWHRFSFTDQCQTIIITGFSGSCQMTIQICFVSFEDWFLVPVHMQGVWVVQFVLKAL